MSEALNNAKTLHRLPLTGTGQGADSLGFGGTTNYTQGT